MEQSDFTDSPLFMDDRGRIRVKDSRITLDILVHRFQLGDTVEDLQDGFPSVSLRQIKSVIDWYLNHTVQADEYIAKGDAEAEEILKGLQSDPRHKAMRELIKQRWEQKQRSKRLIKN